LGLFGYLAICAGLAEIVFGVCFFVFITRLLSRPPTPVSEDLGSSQKVLRKVRKGEPMSKDELEFARRVVADRGSLLAYSIPATVFTLGCFYLFAGLELHGTTSLRTFIGLGPMLGGINLTIRLLRDAALKRRLRNIS